MMENLLEVGGIGFEDLMQANQHDAEYWSARDLHALAPNGDWAKQCSIGGVYGSEWRQGGYWTRPTAP